MNGIETQLGKRAEIIRLDLLSPIGRQAAQTYGVRMVPVVLLFDGRGQLIYRHTGLPDARHIITLVADPPPPA